MSSQQATLAIGAVLARLQDEFPDLSLSKVRFLDAQGVVSPERADSGYRRYSERDVERLRFVLRCQRDRFWPLKVIKDALDAFDRGLEPATDQRPTAPAAQDDPDAPTLSDLVGEQSQPLRLSAGELSAAAGVDEGAINDLVEFGLLKRDAEGFFDADSLQIARAAGALMGHGIGARHLRPFRLAADREISLVRQLSIGPNQRSEAEVVRECLALHLALVRAGLQG